MSNVDFKSILYQYGDTREFTLRTFTYSGDDWNPNRTPVDIPNILGVQGILKKDDIDGTLIQKNDVVFLLYYTGEILTEHILIDGSTEYQIIMADFFKPGSTVLAQKLFCRI